VDGMMAGLLTERLTIQASALSSDSQGGRVTAAATVVCRIWAQPVVRGATELLQAESVASHAQMQFRVRVRSDINAGQTVLWAARSGQVSSTTYQILGVQPDPDRQSMLLTCAVVQ